jgi:hypothetical protein
MTENELKQRTKLFAHHCANLACSFSSTFLENHIQKQLIRCSTLVAANYCAACVSQPKKSFIASRKTLQGQIKN